MNDAIEFVIIIALMLNFMMMLLVIKGVKATKEYTSKFIELKNINLSGITLEEQIEKVKEEDQEFLKAIEKHDVVNAVEEWWDKGQSGLGALKKIGVNAEYVMEQYPQHLEKLKNRPRNK